ncbi:threonine synthase [Crossiella equi]|uniref:threonine synthase n=1 Tax=Crossiella equi TaxID=130796 RepID=UPI001B803653|nr:threonine synthase [Crossiella equi]
MLPALRCARCSEEYPVASLVWRCRCGGVLDVADFGAKLPGLAELAGRPATLWRYAEALPLPEDPSVTLGEGMTPLVSLGGVRAKLEFLLPTLSFKDRGAVVLATLARHLGVQRLVADSSGNAGTALSAYAARVGIPCEIYVPASTSPGKLAQMRSHGANVHLIEGNREAAAAAAKQAAAEPGNSYASHMFHPYFFHGTKTFAFELWEQCGGALPDTVVLPVGHGTLALGACLGFRELLAQGLIPRLPVVVAVQAANCAPLAVAADAGATEAAAITPVPTKAEGIAIAEPARGHQILTEVAATGGTVVGVPDEAVLAARADLARSGVYVETTSAVVWAAITAARTGQAPDSPAWAAAVPHLRAEDLVLALSGAGLKSV